MDDLTPEEFAKKEKAREARLEASWERAKEKGMSKEEFMDARRRGEMKASRDVNALEKRIDLESRTYKDPSSGRVRSEPKLSGGLGGGIDIEGLPQRLRPGGNRMAKGGKIKSASARADGCAQRGKTRGKIV